MWNYQGVYNRQWYCYTNWFAMGLILTFDSIWLIIHPVKHTWVLRNVEVKHTSGDPGHSVRYSFPGNWEKYSWKTAWERRWIFLSKLGLILGWPRLGLIWNGFWVWTEFELILIIWTDLLVCDFNLNWSCTQMDVKQLELEITWHKFEMALSIWSWNWNGIWTSLKLNFNWFVFVHFQQGSQSRVFFWVNQCTIVCRLAPWRGCRLSLFCEDARKKMQLQDPEILWSQIPSTGYPNELAIYFLQCRNVLWRFQKLEIFIWGLKQCTLARFSFVSRLSPLRVCWEAFFESRRKWCNQYNAASAFWKISFERITRETHMENVT